MARQKKSANKDKADIALELYLQTDKSQKEICLIVGWTEKTFTNHKKKGMWDELKGAIQVTPAKIIANLYQQLYNLSLDEKKIDADKLIKVANAIEKLSSRKVTVSNCINVFKDFITWCFTHDAEKAKEINELQKLYIDTKINGGG